MVAAVVFTVYLATVPVDISWAFQATDGTELMTAAVTLGVPHPPGYPPYVLLGHLFSRLPFGAVPFRFGIFSAASMSVAVALIAATAPHIRFRERAGYGVGAVAAALTLAFLAPVWQHAIVPEVYALNLAVVTALLWAVITRRPAALVGLLFGLALTTHGTSLLLLPLVLALTPWRQWPRLGAATLLGLAPLLALPLLAQQGSPVVWGEPRRLDGWWWLVTAQLYRPNLFALGAGEALSRLGRWIWSAQLAVPALGLLVSLPLARLRGWPRPTRRAAFLALTAFLYLIFAATYRTPDAVVLLLPGLACTFLLLVPLFDRLGPAGLGLPVLLLLVNFGHVGPQDNESARTAVENVLIQAPPEAILLTEGDATTFMLWYVQEVERQRVDLVVVDRNLFGFDWYRRRLASRYSWMPYAPDYDLDSLTSLGRPLCKVQLAEGLAEFDCGAGV
jgi:hypothetical protein